MLGESTFCKLGGHFILSGTFSRALIPDGCSERFTKENCDNPDWIYQIGDSYSYQVRDSTVQGDSINIDFKGFYGRDTVWEIISNHNVLMPYELDISDVHATVFKVVVVHEGTGEVRTIYQRGTDGPGLIALSPGKHTVKLIGYDARGSLYMKLSVPPGVLTIDRFTNRW
jgi:hypothetical protein